MAKNSAPLIARLARQLRLDPAAVLAVARGEGGLVNREQDIGDLAGGGSYGPFQLYAQGELPGRFRGNPRVADAWAWSPEGIKYALSRMAQSGAAGLRGPRAVETIIRRFERPADPNKSVRLALNRLGAAPAVGAMPGLPARATTGVSAQGGSRRLALLRGLMQGDDLSGLVQRLRAVAPPSTGIPLATQAPIVGRERTAGRFNPAELFYDPAGGKYRIGGHQHVHAAFRDPQQVLRAIALAQRLGLSVRENPFTDPVDPVHVKGSHHYRTFPGLYRGRRLGEAIDVSGPPNREMQFLRALAGLR